VPGDDLVDLPIEPAGIAELDRGRSRQVPE
jgi:hypothetical protein